MEYSSLSAPGEAVAVFGDPDGVLVVDVHRTLGHRGRRDALKVRGQERGVLLALLGPAVDLGQLDPADRGVDVGHPVVEADDLVLVLPLHALVAVEAHQALGLIGRQRRPCRPRPRSCSWWDRARTSQTTRTLRPECRSRDAPWAWAASSKIMSPWRSANA